MAPSFYSVPKGRSSGKSTLLLALLRLLDTQSGSIEVDGIDLSLVPLSTIRERCFITVTQDPFLLAQASLRFNLDVSTQSRLKPTGELTLTNDLNFSLSSLQKLFLIVSSSRHLSELGSLDISTLIRKYSW